MTTMESSVTWAGAVISLLTFLGVIANMVNNAFREQRARRWAVEDAAALRERLERDKAELAMHTKETANDATKSLELKFAEQKTMLEGIIAAGEARLKQIVSKIDENTAVSKEAFKEANNVNEKLHALGLEQVKQQSTPQQVVVSNVEPIPVKEIK